MASLAEFEQNLLRERVRNGIAAAEVRGQTFGRKPGHRLSDRYALEVVDALLGSGAGIEEINTVRKHVSVLKSGGLARLAYPARTLAFLLSDVIGDDPSAIEPAG